ncbi:MAG: YIP1 family protein [Candidatus Korobacteraceae bacterium]|jgi:Yip1-like protein
MSSAVPAVPIEEKPLSEMERIADTFIAPSKTFTDLRRSANWLVPWLLMSIVGVALVFVVDKRVGMQTAVENALARQPKRLAQLDQLSADKREAQMQVAATITRVIAYSSPIVLVIILAISATVMLGTFNFGFGAELTFNQTLAIFMYATLPSVIQSLVAMLAIFVGGSEGFTFDNPVASNLSGLVDIQSHFLYAVALSLDVFTIWTLVLLGIGFSCLTKVKRGTCMGVVFGWWILWVLSKGGLALLSA